MKKLYNNAFWLISLSVLLCGTIVTYAQTNTDSPSKKSPVDFKADFIRPVKVGDSSAINLLGNVVFYHKDNGTIITCDSAIRYSNTRIECFKNVVVNKQDTYLYGDRVDYDGDKHLAKIYAPIIKMVNKDATMYTHQFAFNTLTNIGIFGGGATMRQRDNILESDRGFFLADSSILVCVKDVEIENPDYKLKSDSVEYNMNSDVATFYTKTFIWNSKGEILSAKKGVYDQRNTTYSFTSDSYILTEGQELWSDTLDYDSKAENATLHSNIQMLDDDKKVMLFGDFAEYWGGIGSALITENPSIINFDPEQPDTLYMRSDTIFIYTVSADSMVVYDQSKIDGAVTEEEYIEGAVSSNIVEVDSLGSRIGIDSVGSDSSRVVVESVIEGDSTNIDGSRVIIQADSTKIEGDSVSIEKTTPKKLSWFEKIKLRRKSKKIAKKAKYEAEQALRVKERMVKDSINKILMDSTNIKIPQYSILIDSLALVDTTEGKDSVQHIIRAYNNVRIYRSDFQAVCDSMVGLSIDSTLHLYIKPVLWNQANQITSTQIDIYTKNQAMDKAVFTGEPIMASRVDKIRFNQVKGQVIEAIMIDNQIKRTEVIGNGQTYYYMQDDEDGSLKGFLVVESADITFIMDSNTVETINYKKNPVYSLHPMDKIPLTQEILLPGFKWEEKRRPMRKESVFNRSIRATRREEYESKSIPMFNITKNIFDSKEKMIQDGVWRERDEVITESTLHGM